MRLLLTTLLMGMPLSLQAARGPAGERRLQNGRETPVAPRPAAPKITERIRNDRVIATEVVLQPGESATEAGKLPAIIVYLQAPAGAQAGEVRYAPPGAHVIRNTGKSELRFVRVDFPGPGSGETWGTKGLAPHYKLLLENRHARVYDIRIPAHTDEPQHTHHDRVVMCLSGATLRHRFPDGREEPSTLKTGEIAWRRGGTHMGRNLGATDLWVIAVEPK